MQNNIKKLNFVFFGTPDVASGTLEILKQAGFLPSLIVTSPDARAGRKMLIPPPPVKVWAIENNIPYIQPEKLDEEFCNQLKPSCLEPNCLFIVVAYGKIMPKNVLEMPRLGSINIHYSLLPKYRGASPVESAILNGDRETGITIQQMEYKMDSGAIIAQEKVEILPEEKAPELRKRLIKIGGEFLVKTLSTSSALQQVQGTSPYVGGGWVGVKQDESKATYCVKIKKEDGLVNIETDSDETLWRKFRAYSHWPRTFFFKDDKRIIITDAELVDNKFVIKKILPEGKKEIDYKNTN